MEGRGRRGGEWEREWELPDSWFYFKLEEFFCTPKTLVLFFREVTCLPL